MHPSQGKAYMRDGDDELYTGFFSRTELSRQIQSDKRRRDFFAFRCSKEKKNDEENQNQIVKFTVSAKSRMVEWTKGSVRVVYIAVRG